MKHALAGAAVAAVAFLSAGSADAATYTRITMSQLVAVLQSAGASVASTSSAEVIQVGASFVWLTDCNAQGACSEINFFRNYRDVRPSLQAVNTWNNTKKIPEASINADGTLHMEMWISAVGTTDANIVDSMSWFERYAADTEYWGPWITRSGV